MITVHSIRYEAFKVSKSHKRKNTGAEVVVGEVMSLIAGLDALGLDGYQLVAGNNRHDLPPEGGLWEAELGSSVLPATVDALNGVSVDALLAAVPSAPASLREHFLALRQFYADAAQAGAGVNLFPLAD